mmetsp:Transcript_18199/g.46201  ORF Transcript_18199/g.46201 Transcript_18199/m.46201 type:complete len:1044 (-) Transcript_18199:88-3219(-)|eukprot:CAMPEP_0177645876 /NCGR_PEP_ID=MMETSP0447-20121125/9479_1 /TAXON_ID=0 /ORGANISM="Stygamoeba regulata, Strain BSH-02190019" /LENGTH=1043 /DNA_ID=CAMNT_0019148381 /DNA_START=113 /DNA_END=3244 /DNA_ORIENTATION=-
MAATTTALSASALNDRIVHCYATNDVRQLEEIQKLLLSSPESLILLRTLLSSGSSLHVRFLASTTLSELTRTHYAQLSPESRDSFRTFLWQWLPANSSALPAPVLATLSLALVRLELHHWSSSDTTLLQRIVTWLSVTDHQSLACRLLTHTLQALSDSAASSHLLVSRKKELTALLTTHLTDVTGAMNPALLALISATQHCRSMDETSQRLVLLLDAYGALFALISLDKITSASLLHPLLQCLHFQDARGSSAFQAIIELLSHNFVPKEVEQFVCDLFMHVFTLLQAIAKSPNISHTDKEYLQKVNRFTAVFVDKHLQRLDMRTSFPIGDFLRVLFEITMVQEDIEALKEALEVWDLFLDYCLALQENESLGMTACRGASQPTPYTNYEAGLLDLLGKLMNEMQYVSNSAKLLQLDDGADEGEESEREEYIDFCLRIIDKIAELFPATVPSRLGPHLSKLSDAFVDGVIAVARTRQAAVSSASSSSSSTATSSAPAASAFSASASTVQGLPQELAFVSRDLSAVVQIYSRMAPYLAQSPQSMFVYLEHVVKLLRFGLDLEASIANSLGPDFIGVIVSAFESLRSYGHWIRHVDINFHASNQEQSAKLFSWLHSVAEVVAQTLVKEHPLQVGVSAAQFLHHLCCVMRPSCLHRLTAVGALRERTTVLCGSLRPPVLKPFLSAMAGSLLFPIVGQSTLAAENTSSFVEFFRPLLEKFAQFTSQDLSAVAVRENGIFLMQVFVDICQDLMAEGHSASKALFSDSFSPALPFLKNLLEKSFNYPDLLTTEIRLIRTLLRIMTDQQRLNGILMIVLNLLSNSARVQAILRDSQSQDIATLESFISLLNMVMGRGNTKVDLQPLDVVRLCINVVIPHASNNPDVLKASFELLYTCMLSHMDKLPEEAVLESTKALLVGIRTPHLHVSGECVRNLQMLNDRKRLFHAPAFKSAFWVSTLQLVLDVLIAKEHNSLREELIDLLFTVAKQDFQAFFNEFLPKYLASSSALTVEEKEVLRRAYGEATDYPSFKRNTDGFVDDAVHLLRSKQQN